MTKEQYAEMLRDISETHKIGGDISACIAKYRKRYKFVYIYNDTIFKLIFGNPQNMELTANFLNAILKLDGGDCIDKLTFVNPAVDGSLSKTVISDVVVEREHLERIVMEVQHVEGDAYNDRLVYYVAKHTVASKTHNEGYWLRDLNLISLQMFDGFPESRNYRHSIRLKNQENDEFFKKQTITLVEIPKFLKDGYSSDNSLLAQWLRVIDGLNNEKPVPVPEGSIFARLQEKAKLSIFTEEFLVSEAKNMGDRLYEMYVEKKQARAEGLAEGRAEGRAEGLEKGLAEGRAEGIDILESLGVPSDLIEKARKIAAEKAKESPNNL